MHRGRGSWYRYLRVGTSVFRKLVVIGGVLTTGGADLDVQSVDAKLLAAGGDVLGSQHGSVGGGLVTVGLDLHATSDTGDGLAAAGITQKLASPFFSFDNLDVCIHESTNLRSVMWTKVSLKEAKIRATPNTSSPGDCQLLAWSQGQECALENILPSRTEGPKEMFSLGAAATFLGGMLDWVGDV